LRLVATVLLRHRGWRNNDAPTPNATSHLCSQQHIGGNNLTHDICSHYGMSYEDAENAKRNANLPENYYTDVLQPFVEKLSVEVSRALQFFFTSTHFNKVDHIVLTGGCALLSGLEERITPKPDPFGYRQPFSNMALSQRIKPRQLTKMPALMVACGLRMRRLTNDASTYCLIVNEARAHNGNCHYGGMSG
jgi:type IV pilus assembly protein PilM